MQPSDGTYTDIDHAKAEARIMLDLDSDIESDIAEAALAQVEWVKTDDGLPVYTVQTFKTADLRSPTIEFSFRVERLASIPILLWTTLDDESTLQIKLHSAKREGDCVNVTYELEVEW